MEVVMDANISLINQKRIDLSCLRQICIESPIIVIKTPCGIGKYIFDQIYYENNNLAFQYRLIYDEKFEGYLKIKHNIGDYLKLTPEQLLYTFKFYANS